MKKLFCLVFLVVLLAGCELAQPEDEDGFISVSTIWHYYSDHIYSKGDRCFFGKEDGENIIWQSVQNNNLGHQPSFWEGDRIVANLEWWKNIN